MYLQLPDSKKFDLTKPRLMGILNVTPDSFSDGDAYQTVDDAVQAALEMVANGADMIDIGGESTRPGAKRISVDEQISRVVSVIQALQQRWACDATLQTVPISIDTTRAAVAEAALEAGASVVNDVSGGRDDATMFELVAKQKAVYVLMHMLGQPATMQHDPVYNDVVNDILTDLTTRAQQLHDLGMTENQIILDPGIGFGKTTEHNLQLIAGLDQFVATGYPILLGTSRKRFIGKLTGINDPKQRDTGTAATTAIGVMQGVQLFRVHQVAINRQVADVTFAVKQHRK